jgi:hypothetical protein
MLAWAAARLNPGYRRWYLLVHDEVLPLFDFAGSRDPVGPPHSPILMLEGYLLSRAEKRESGLFLLEHLKELSL